MKWFALMGASAMVLAAGGLWGEAADEAAEPEGWGLDGAVLAFGGSPADHPGGQGYEEFECETEPQLSVVVTDQPGCGDFGGTHVMGDEPVLRIGFRSQEAGDVGAIPFTGVLVAHVEWLDSLNEIVHRCQWNMGEFVACGIGSPPVPPMPGEEFTFSCYSEPLDPTSGSPASFGHWGECFIGHS